MAELSSADIQAISGENRDPDDVASAASAEGAKPGRDGSSDQPAIWFYESAGGKHGPVTAGQLRAMFDKGTIDENTLVWSSAFGSEWRPLKQSGLVLRDEGAPPPLPASHLNNAYAWLLAFVPIIGLVVERVLADTTSRPRPPDTSILVAYTFVNIALSYLDELQIKKSGRNPNSVSLIWWVWLVPVYLYQRAKALHQKPVLLGVWAASFAAMIAISSSPGLFAGSTYFGLGLPACNAATSISTVKSVFDDIPLVKQYGVKAISVGEIKQSAYVKTMRTCAAEIAATNGEAIEIEFTIGDQDGEIMYNVEIQ